MRKQYRLKSEVSVSNSTSINFVTKPSNEPRWIRSEFPGLKGRRYFVKNFVGMQKRYEHCFTEYKDASTDYVTDRDHIMLFNVEICIGFLTKLLVAVPKMHSEIINNTDNINIIIRNCNFKWATEHAEKSFYINVLQCFMIWHALNLFYLSTVYFHQESMVLLLIS